jgi:ABC-2 type transport system ATP-binding protein
VHLSVQGLSRRFGAVQALTDVSLSADAGEVVALIGPNGAGKSTLLACIAGVARPDAGVISLDGRPTDAIARRRQCLYLPDTMIPWMDQPAAWGLDLACTLLGAANGWRGAAADLLDVPSYAARPLGQLSKGQRKRVLLTLALAVARPLTLLDEPFDGLDPRQSRHFSALVRDASAMGRTFVLSVHSADDAVRTCDRHVLLHEGRVLADGTLTTLRTQASLANDAGLEEVFLALT